MVPHTPPLRVGLLLLGWHYFLRGRASRCSLCSFCVNGAAARRSLPQALTVVCKPVSRENKKGALHGAPFSLPLTNLDYSACTSGSSENIASNRRVSS